MRESLSTMAVKRQGVECSTVPDVILTSQRLRDHRRPADGMEVKCTDSAGAERDGFKPFMQPAEYLEQLDRCRAVVCGRFHAVLCCMVLGIPFTAYASNTWKNKAMMNDACMSHLYRELRADALEVLPAEVSIQAATYVEAGRLKIDKMFEDLWELN